MIGQTQPLVTIGIPTYNRAAMLRRAIESALGQDYSNIEVIISNNASTDETQEVCQEYSKKDNRVKYVTQSSNIGVLANFAEVLKRASGEYFMWLGDDDWIDDAYVKHCTSLLIADPSLALVSGVPTYYRDGEKIGEGKLFDLLEDLWTVRVAFYYSKVEDNGMFYGIMRTAQIQLVVFPNNFGGDWHLIANIVSAGKTKMCSAVSAHREMGMSASYRDIVKSLGLPTLLAVFPMTTIAIGAAWEIVFSGAAYKKRGLLTRIVLAVVVFLRVIARPLIPYLASVKNLVKRNTPR